VWYKFSQIVDDQNQPQKNPSDIGSVPPVHDGCHCQIETLPGGRKIWKFTNHCCGLCRSLGENFNRNQSKIFGI